jgi:hypothetical protein
MLQHKVAFDTQRFFTSEGRGVGELEASLDNYGMNLIQATRSAQSITASVNADERLGHFP